MGLELDRVDQEAGAHTSEPNADLSAADEEESCMRTLSSDQCHQTQASSGGAVCSYGQLCSCEIPAPGERAPRPGDTVARALPPDVEARLSDDAYVFQQYRKKRITAAQLALAMASRHGDEPAAAAGLAIKVPPSRSPEACFLDLVEGKPYPDCLMGVCGKHGSYVVTMANNFEKRDREQSDLASVEVDRSIAGSQVTDDPPPPHTCNAESYRTGSRVALRQPLQAHVCVPDAGKEEKGACKQQ
jgi:hypothetical protein